jgi:ABC-2 type transport system ATP-binding protein
MVDAVEKFAAGRAVWDRRSIGSQESVVVSGVLDDDDRARARQLHVSLTPLSLQQLVAHVPGRSNQDLKEDQSA